MHVGACPDAHRPEAAGGDPYMHVGAGLDIQRPRVTVEIATCT